MTLGAILDVTGADRGAVVLRRTDRRPATSRCCGARAQSPVTERFAVSRTLVSSVIAKGVSVFAHDASSDARFSDGQSVIGQRVRSVMCVPLRTTDEILGALYVDSLSGAGRFNEADLELLAAIGNQAGVAMHRVRLIGELERLLLDTIKAIAATIDARDGYTHRHSERVAALPRQLALEMGLERRRRQTAELSALLHDVGKIAVPDSILNKPGRLTPEEFAEMQKHPVHGAQILGNIQSPTVKAVLPGVQYHHEKMGRHRLSRGAQGEAIPFLGRLLGVADFYDALTSARAYRSPKPLDEVVRSCARRRHPLRPRDCRRRRAPARAPRSAAGGLGRAPAAAGECRAVPAGVKSQAPSSKSQPLPTAKSQIKRSNPNAHSLPTAPPSCSA